jgi:hypothetical protein
VPPSVSTSMVEMPMFFSPLFICPPLPSALQQQAPANYC